MTEALSPASWHVRPNRPHAGAALAGLPSWYRRYGFAIGVGLVLICALAAIWVRTIQNADQAERQAVDTNLAIVAREANQMAAEWAARLERIRVLHGFARAVSRAVLDHDPALPARLADLRRDLELAGPELIQAAGIDPKGILAWTTLTMPNPPSDLSRREHFQAIASRGESHFIGTPVKGTVSGKWTFQSAEPMRAADGTLEQVTVISIDTAIIRTLTHYFDKPEASGVTLFRSDGLVLARLPERSIGETMNLAGSNVGRALANPAEVAVGRTRSGLDGVARFYAARAISGTDMVVSVGIDEDTVLAPVRTANARANIMSWELSLLCCALAFTSVYTRECLNKARTRAAIAENARREEALLHRIAGRAGDIILLIDGNGNKLYFNDAFMRLTGSTREESIGRPYGDAILPEDRPIAAEAVAALEAHGGARRFTVRVNAHGGGVRWLETEVVLVPFDGTAPDDGCRYIAIARDVTARIAGEAALQRAHEALETLCLSGPGALYRAVLAPSGEIHVVPGAGTDAVWLGYTEQEWSKADFLRRIVWPDDQVPLERFLDALRTHGTATVEYRVRHRNGRIPWHRNVSNALRTPDGEWIASGYIVDITAEKTQSQQLEEARRIISLGEMASGIAHEFSQPLAVIGIAAENARAALAASPPLIEPVLGKLDQIEAMVQRARSIIDEMRSMRKREAETIARESLSVIAREARDVLRQRLEDENVTLILDVPATLPGVFGSRLLLEQVLINLIANAADAYLERPAGEKPIMVSGVAEGEYVVLRVADRAGGIPPDISRRIFEPFFTTKSGRGGTGLGLSVCQGIVMQANGTLQVHNELDGAVFEIRLPALGGGTGLSYR